MLTPNFEKMPQVLDPESARRFLQTIFGPYLKEATRLTYIEVRGKLETDEKMTFRRFYFGVEPLLKDMTNWPADQHYWFGIALRRDGKHGKKEDCTTLTVLFQDVDYDEAGHKKKNRWQTREEAQAAIDRSPITPSIVVHTGGGFQVYWIIKKPFEIANGNYAQVEAIMKGIGAAIGGDDGTQDVSRIFRIPGTFNVKTDEPRPVELISCNPDLVYDLADFAHNADQGEESEQADLAPPASDTPQTTSIFELNVPKWVKGLPIRRCKWIRQ
ncbi:MAG: DNA-primase RepB domain-containing protein [Desulfobaccales bacterium]